jgi:aspartate oxidase
MGIGVETSRLDRHAAELAAGAIGDDARQDKDHADDTEQVGRVLRDESVVTGVLAGQQVQDDVADAGRHHQQQPHATQDREGAHFENEPLPVFYRQHGLVIHFEPGIVKVYR